jgi:hypothetical protein
MEHARTGTRDLSAVLAALADHRAALARLASPQVRWPVPRVMRLALPELTGGDLARWIGRFG